MSRVCISGGGNFQIQSKFLNNEKEFVRLSGYYHEIFGVRFLEDFLF